MWFWNVKQTVEELVRKLQKLFSIKHITTVKLIASDTSLLNIMDDAQLDLFVTIAVYLYHNLLQLVLRIAYLDTFSVC